MFNSDVSQSTLDMAGKVSVTAATWKLLYEKELDMVELFMWNRTDGYSIVKPEIKNKVGIPEMLPHKCATEVLAETEKFVEPIDNYSAGKRILAGEQEGAQIVYFKLAKAEIDSNYLDNERVLEHIIDVIRRISEDPEVEIARVVLLGLSHPRGLLNSINNCLENELKR